MRIIIFSILCLALSIFSCTKSDNDQTTGGTPQTKIIRLPGLVGEGFYVSIESEISQCTLELSEPEVASAKLIKDKKAVHVKMLNIGETSITVVNSEGNKIAIIYVRASYFSGQLEEWRRVENIESEIIVEATDSQIKQSIHNELSKELELKLGTKYTFDADTKKFTMDIEQTAKKYRGVYAWNIDSLFLKYDDTVEKYSFDHCGSYYYVIEANKTKEYQLKYPQAGITDIRIKRVWLNLNYIPGITDTF